MVPLNRFGQQGMDSPLQPPNFTMPMMMNPAMSTPQYGYPNFFPDGSQPVFSAPPYDMARPESAPESGSGQGSLNFAGSYPRPWNMAPGMGTFEQSPNNGQGNMEGIVSDNNAPAMFQGDYGRSPRQMASLPSAIQGIKGSKLGKVEHLQIISARVCWHRFLRHLLFEVASSSQMKQILMDKDSDDQMIVL